MSETVIKSKLSSAKFKEAHNEHEWTPELDEVLKKLVLTHYFNFNLVSLELNEEAASRGIKFGTANAYTNEKCRLRWFYLHCDRSLKEKSKVKKAKKEEKKIKQQIKSNGIEFDIVDKNKLEKKTPTAPPVIDKTFKEDANINAFPNTQVLQQQNSEESKLETKDTLNGNLKDPNVDKIEQHQTQDDSNEPRRLLESSNRGITTREIKTYEEAAQYQWRQNIAPSRTNRDFLDISNENFSKNKTIDIEGNEISPSCFNIFRDSLKKSYAELKSMINDNLPEIKLDDTESDDNEEVVPLDFRTKLIGSNNVVLQVKPLKLYTSDDDDGLTIGDFLKKASTEKKKDYTDLLSEDYLRKYRQEPFKDDEDDPAVTVLLQPANKFKEKLESVTLECNRAEYLNNCINAPKSKRKAPKINKVYKQDEEENEAMKKIQEISRRKKRVTINEEKTQINYIPNREDEYYPPSAKHNDEMLDLERILKSQGVSINNFMEEEETKDEKPKQTVFNSDNIMQLLAMENFENNKEEQDEEEEEPQPDLEAVDENQNSENEVAPLGAIVDEKPKDPKKEKLSHEAKKKLAFRKSVVEASSASEDERGWKENKNPALSSEEEMIDTTKEGQAQLNAPNKSLAANTKSTSTNSGLILKVPGLFPPTSAAPESSAAPSAPHPYPRPSTTPNLPPDALLFKHNSVQPSAAGQVPSDPYGRTKSGRGKNKVNYRGVWLDMDNKHNQEQDDEVDANAVYFNSQRKLMKERIKDKHSAQFDDIDAMKVEDLKVKEVDGEKFVHVHRDWQD